MSRCSQRGRWKVYSYVVIVLRKQRVVDTNISDFSSIREKKFSNELSLRAGCLDAFGKGLRCYPLG